MEIKNFDKSFGAFICVNTTECASWCDCENPLVQKATSREELDRLGWDEDVTDMKVGEVRESSDFVGAYLMRVG
jgi:hypothetical protein